MYKYIFKNKLVFLAIASAIAFYTFLKYQETKDEKNITKEDFSSKILDTEVLSEQINKALEQDTKNVLIDNDILNGKIQLPEVAYTDPAISDLFVTVIDNDSLHKYIKGSVVFN